MSKQKKVDWNKINAKLPIDRSLKEQRKRLFRSFDPNGNGVLSLAEVSRQTLDILHGQHKYGSCSMHGIH